MTHIKPAVKVWIGGPGQQLGKEDAAIMRDIMAAKFLESGLIVQTWDEQKDDLVYYYLEYTERKL